MLLCHSLSASISRRRCSNPASRSLRRVSKLLFLSKTKQLQVCNNNGGPSHTYVIPPLLWLDPWLSALLSLPFPNSNYFLWNSPTNSRVQHPIMIARRVWQKFAGASFRRRLSPTHACASRAPAMEVYEEKRRPFLPFCSQLRFHGTASASFCIYGYCSEVSFVSFSVQGLKVLFNFFSLVIVESSSMVWLALVRTL